MGHKNLWVGVMIVCAVALTACRSTQHVHVWNERYIVAARAQDEGRHDEARAHYAQLLKHAPDEPARRLILYREALMLEEEARLEEALAAYAAIYSGPARDEYGARALHRAASLTDEAGDKNAALSMYEALLSSYGEWVAAEHAVAYIKRYHAQQSGGEGALKELAAYREDVRGESVEGDYLMEVASLHASLGQIDEALATYDEVLAASHLSAYWDDALWEQASLLRQEKAWTRALGKLEVLATSFQETSWFMGDYSSEHSDQARYEMGRIYLEELAKPEEAVAQFDRFLKDFEFNLLVDDVAWQRLRALREAGNTSRYERELERFPKNYPESRYLRRLNKGERP